ncbi:MAG: anaerobic ribonucleoside-triphosphate reductase activating protein [Candidatus Methanoperedens sp.]|nr:anaerobic ribonucleoside-triphosphate reductase activating protein [Candidatus Methanoperedens sp.]
MSLIFSGVIIPISTIDWYGRSASVVFFNGCNFNCLYCSNNKFIEVANRLEPLFKKGNVVVIEEIEKHILDAKNFISAVVFSGGEPTAHFEELQHLAGFAKKEGLLVGIETNGYYPERLEKLIKKRLLDKIFLDVKAPLNDMQKYKMITGGIKDATLRVSRTLDLRDAVIEVRTTVFRSFADDCFISGIAKALSGRGCTYVIQKGIPEFAPDERLQKEAPFSRDELAAFARSLDFLDDVRIRTKEKGEERIIKKV